eukprot:CAMPEP_0183342956 /NCGR_PEP_ID=MMETSP0164_2-20130417/8964_1 /TAXON_ID=221442 /ORGANISM="Coccolithus pelagicus ssp braarudi, Strain PLY182g" /LENGTH=191 /DNA_ID=CAMNT_0025513681 /DNA_START=94 /DNA_END=667 /DNA_ORIENTATION=-
MGRHPSPPFERGSSPHNYRPRRIHTGPRGAFTPGHAAPERDLLNVLRSTSYVLYLSDAPAHKPVLPDLGRTLPPPLRSLYLAPTTASTPRFLLHTFLQALDRLPPTFAHTSPSSHPRLALVSPSSRPRFAFTCSLWARARFEVGVGTGAWAKVRDGAEGVEQRGAYAEGGGDGDGDGDGNGDGDNDSEGTG